MKIDEAHIFLVNMPKVGDLSWTDEGITVDGPKLTISADILNKFGAGKVAGQLYVGDTIGGIGYRGIIQFAMTTDSGNGNENNNDGNGSKDADSNNNNDNNKNNKSNIKTVAQTGTKITDAPETGDKNSFWLFTGLATGSLCGMFITAKVVRKKANR